MSCSERARVDRVRSLGNDQHTTLARPAPKPRPYFPELDRQTIRALCIRVQGHFDRQYGRQEIHLFWQALEGVATGTIFWQKLNCAETIGTGSHFYKWFCALLGTLSEGAEMMAENFEGIEAMVTLRTSGSEKPYTIIDSGQLPARLSCATEVDKSSADRAQPITRPLTRTLTPTHTQHPYPASTPTSTHTQQKNPSIIADEIPF